MELLSLKPDFCEAAAECGLRSFIIMAGSLDGKVLKSELLSYEGPFGVGYCVCAFAPVGEDEGHRFGAIYENHERERLKAIKEQEDFYVRLARLSLENYIKTGTQGERPEGMPESMLNTRAGVFVSLKKHGQLRGCIGTISPVTSSVADEIWRNAVSAGTEDPRFGPVTEAELAELVYSVDVLSPAEPIASAGELDVKRYGVVVSSGHKRGLLLPNLAGVDTVEQQVGIALQKAGINQGEPYSMERFEVVRHT